MGIDPIAPEAFSDPDLAADGLSDDEAVELAIRRDAEIEAGAVVPLTHHELMQRLRP